MSIWAAVAAGGALGAVARHATIKGAMVLWGVNYPYGTLAVNIGGSLLMGLMVGIFAKMLPVNDAVRAFVAVGFLGSYTTFSTFSLDVVTLFQRGETFQVALYIMASVTLSVLALIGGLALARII